MIYYDSKSYELWSFTTKPDPLHKLINTGKIKVRGCSFVNYSLKFFDYMVLDSTDNSEFVVANSDRNGIAQYRLYDKNGQPFYVVVDGMLIREGFYNFTTISHTNYDCKICDDEKDGVAKYCKKNIKLNTKLCQDAYKWAKKNGLTEEYADGLGYIPKGYRW